jgi:serine/threonine protein kinase
MTLARQINSIRKNPSNFTFSEQEIVNTVEPIVRVLRGLHAGGFVHGGIRPDSILIDYMGVLKVYVPGICRTDKGCYY